MVTQSARVTKSYIFAFLSSSKLKENLTELHIIVRTTGFIVVLDEEIINGRKKIFKHDVVVDKIEILK